jgi:hypothetical protein
MSLLSDLLSLAANEGASEQEVRTAARKALEALQSFDHAPVVLTLEVRGEKFDVGVNSEGIFYAEFMNARYVATTLADLRKRLMDATKKASIQVSVPYSRLVIFPAHKDRPAKVIHGIARGIHSKTRHILVTEGGKASTLEWPRNIFRKLTEAEAVEVERLFAAQQEAEKAFNTYVEPMTIKLSNVVQDAVTEVFNQTPALDSSEEEVSV